MCNDNDGEFLLLFITNPTSNSLPARSRPPRGTREASSVLLPEGYLIPQLANNRFNHDQGTFACGGTCLVGIRTTLPRCSEENIGSY